MTFKPLDPWVKFKPPVCGGGDASSNFTVDLPLGEHALTSGYYQPKGSHLDPIQLILSLIEMDGLHLPEFTTVNSRLQFQPLRSVVITLPEWYPFDAPMRRALLASTGVKLLPSTSGPASDSIKSA